MMVFVLRRGNNSAVRPHCGKAAAAEGKQTGQKPSRPFPKNGHELRWKVLDVRLDGPESGPGLTKMRRLGGFLFPKKKKEQTTSDGDQDTADQHQFRRHEAFLSDSNTRLAGCLANQSFYYAGALNPDGRLPGRQLPLK